MKAEDWAPRELRHTFVSVMSANGVPVENIALLVGHDRTATTESVYRHEIRPALTPRRRGNGQGLWTAPELTAAAAIRRRRAQTFTSGSVVWLFLSCCP